MIAIFILIYLVSLIIYIIMCYQENKRHIFYVKDLIDEIEFHMWFPLLNTIALIVFVEFIFFTKLWELSKLNILWEKFRNIKLKKQMTYKDLFDAQHEYCTTEDYHGTAIRPHAFIAGAKCVIKYLNDLSANEALEAITNLHDELQMEEMQTKWFLKKKSPHAVYKCEDCDRFNECYIRSGRMREFCKMYDENVVFKFKKGNESKN